MVLGSCGAWPEAGRACSGFVVEHEGFRLVLDMGYGTLPRLFDLLASSVGDGIDAVVISHGHPDHMVDLHGLFRARWFARRDAAPIPLFCPPQVIERVCSLEEDDAEAVRSVFDWHELPAATRRVGPFLLDSFVLPHFVTNAGIRLSASDLLVSYTGDTGPSEALEQLGHEADLFIIEATSRHQQSGIAAAADSPALHLTAEAAGRAAAAAGTRRLLLTHFWPGNDRETSRAQAAAVFDGEVLIADEGLEIALP